MATSTYPKLCPISCVWDRLSKQFAAVREKPRLWSPVKRFLHRMHKREVYRRVDRMRFGHRVWSMPWGRERLALRFLGDGKKCVRPS